MRGASMKKNVVISLLRGPCILRQLNALENVKFKRSSQSVGFEGISMRTGILSAITTTLSLLFHASLGRPQCFKCALGGHGGQLGGQLGGHGGGHAHFQVKHFSHSSGGG